MPDTSCSKHLPRPARYFPVTGGRYSARAGLFRFPTDFGNGIADHQVFQFDADFYHNRDNKLAVRKQALGEYVCFTDDAEDSLVQVTQFIIEQLGRHYPGVFRLEDTGTNLHLHCLLSGTEIVARKDYALVSSSNPSGAAEPLNLFDALALELQEDLCVMQVGPAASQLCAAHLCAPNHWAASDKLGMAMPALHTPVPGFTELNRSPDKLLTGIINKQQPYVRFAWGISADRCYNHHPRLSDAQNACDDDDGIYMRIERQLLYPMPDNRTLLFTIKTLFRDCAEIKRDSPEEFIQLVQAINTMGNATLVYKGFDRDEVLMQLNAI